MPASSTEHTVISVKMSVDLKERVQVAAEAAGLTQTQFINFSLEAALPGSSKSGDLTDDIKVLDERSRLVFKDLAARLQRVEEHLGLDS